MAKNRSIAPVLKWVGGKRQILDEIKKYIPGNFGTYHEPFLGGGAVLFGLRPARAVVNDINPELMNVYAVIKDDVEGLIKSLKEHERAYREHRKPSEYFYSIRELDRDKAVYNALAPLQKASRILFLNKTCFNGLFRVNRAGQFNTPFGKYKRPNIVNGKMLRAVSGYFNGADISFSCGDFEAVLEAATGEDFVYLDPPYDPLSDTSSFTGYDRGGFDAEEQARLSRVCRRLDERGVKFLLSNSATELIRELYRGFRMETVKARRAVNARGDGRGDVDEVLIRNYDPRGC